MHGKVHRFCFLPLCWQNELRVLGDIPRGKVFSRKRTTKHSRQFEHVSYPGQGLVEDMEESTHTWTRIHDKSRRAPFTPALVDNGPRPEKHSQASLMNLKAHVCYVTSGRYQIQTLLGQYWTRKTVCFANRQEHSVKAISFLRHERRSQCVRVI